MHSPHHRHPSVHSAWSSWSEDQVLHVVSAYSNPFRYRNRRELFLKFLDHMRHTPNVRLHVVEVAFGDRPFEVTDAADPDCVQLRTNDSVWVKENAINIGLSRIQADWKYAAYVDGDFHFTRHDWALEAIHQLQHYSWVQLFSSYGVMAEDHRPIQIRPSFAYAYHQYFEGKLDTHLNIGAAKSRYGVCNSVIRNTTPGATGGAWGFTREGLDAVGGLLDTCILGAGDWYMSFGLIGNNVDGHPEALGCGKPYAESIRRWQTRAYERIQGNIGYVDNFCTHGWHGDLKHRGYGNRWHILRDHQYDPLQDVVRDWQGLLHWAGNKPRMRDAVQRYFLSRNEDSTEMHSKPLL